jgi:hypothetical protein
LPAGELARTLTALLWLGLPLASAQLPAGIAPTCFTSTLVRASGFAAIEPTPAGAQQRALALALAEAVGMVRGVFVAVETELVERFEATLTREGAFTAGSSSLNQTIQTRTAGLVNAFRVLERREMQGMLQVAIEAEVCMDARIAVRWLGPMQGEEAFLLAFRQAMGETGWQVIPLPRQPLGQGMQLLFDTGATHLATVEARATPAGSSYGQLRFDVRIGVVVLDLVSGAVTSGIETSMAVVGQTEADAHASASSRAAGELANRVLRTVGATDAQGLRWRTLTVTGASRPHSAIELRALLLEAPGVVALEVQGAQGAHELRYALHATTTGCEIAAELLRQRRLLLHIRHCDAEGAVVDILRE